MRILIAILALAAVSAHGQQPDSQAQIQFLQSALIEVQAQRNAALDQIAVVKAQAAAEKAALQKQIADLQPKPESKETK